MAVAVRLPTGGSNPGPARCASRAAGEPGGPQHARYGGADPSQPAGIAGEFAELVWHDSDSRGLKSLRHLSFRLSRKSLRSSSLDDDARSFISASLLLSSGGGAGAGLFLTCAGPGCVGLLSAFLASRRCVTCVARSCALVAATSWSAVGVTPKSNSSGPEESCVAFFGSACFGAARVVALATLTVLSPGLSFTVATAGFLPPSGSYTARNVPVPTVSSSPGQRTDSVIRSSLTKVPLSEPRSRTMS